MNSETATNTETTKKEFKIQTTLKPLLTPDEFAHALGGAIGRNSICQLIHAGRIKHVHIGRKILVLASEVMDFPLREANQPS